jgi:hypothetical protein
MKKMTGGVDGSQMNGAVEREIFGLVTTVRSIVNPLFAYLTTPFYSSYYIFYRS